MSTEILAEAAWRARAAAHAARVDAFVRPHLERRDTQVKHPVHDFLFIYYAAAPGPAAALAPGLRGDAGRRRGRTTARSSGYDGATVAAAYVATQRPLLEALRRLLRATASRPAHTGCFGLHEWAMVYRQAEDETRHADWPLRLGGAGTDEVVESHRIACSHFDAFRFFTEPARPLNTLSPGPETAPPSSSRAACTPAWTSTSTPSGSPR